MSTAPHLTPAPDGQPGRPLGASRSGFTLWLTGLSGAGKSTVAAAVAERLRSEGVAVEVLDGDEVREHLSRGLTFSREDRDVNVRRIAYVAKLLTRNGVAVVTAAISPYRETRADARRMIGDASFVEVFVNASLESCIARDVKGLYAKALAGTIPEFTGVSDPYEAPAAPELELRTDQEPIEASVDRVLHALRSRGHLPALQTAGV